MKEAQDHAEVTGHSHFEESQEAGGDLLFHLQFETLVDHEAHALSMDRKVGAVPAVQTVIDVEKIPSNVSGEQC